MPRSRMASSCCIEYMYTSSDGSAPSTLDAFDLMFTNPKALDMLRHNQDESRVVER